MTNLSDVTGLPAAPRPAPQGDGSAPAVAIGAASALTGLAGVACYAAGVLLPGSVPRPDAASAQVMAFLVHQRGPLLAGLVLQLIAVAFLLWFLGQLRAVVASAGGTGVPLATAMTAGWVVLVTMVGVSMLPAVAITWSGTAATSPGLVRLAWDMQTLGTYALPATAAMVSVAAPSAVIWRYRVLPRWLAVLGTAEVAANVAELAGLSSRHGALAGGYADGIGQILWVAWVAAASVCLALRCRAAKPAR
jgi:hypothetical protein